MKHFLSLAPFAQYLLMKTFAVLFVALLMSFQGTSATLAVEQKMFVYVSITPQKYLVDRIGGDRVYTEVMVKPGYSPETYEPTPGQLRKLSRARIYFRICVPFEEMLLPAIIGGSTIRVVDCNREINYLMPEGMSASGETRPDPHVWTDPVNGRYIAGQIYDVFTTEDPQHEAYYTENYRRLERELLALDEYISGQIKQRGSPYLLVSHAAWGYFCDRYGMRQLALEVDGKPRGPRSLAELVRLVKELNITTIFTQREHRSPADLAFAREINVRVVEIDPLAEDYIGNLKEVTRLFVEAGRR